MEKIEQLEQRIEQLEKKLGAKEDKISNRERLAKASIIHWDSNYRIKFEEKYSFGQDSEYSRFDLKRAVENTPIKPSHKLRYWNKFYLELRDLIEGQDGNQFWDELLFIAKTAVDMYSNEVVRHILKEGKYIGEGGRPPVEKDEIWDLWLQYSENPKSIFPEGERPEDDPGKEAIYIHIAQEVDCSKSKVSKTVRERKKKRKNTP